MKNYEEIEIPKLNIERNPLFLAIFGGIGLILAYFDYYLFNTFNPWGFLVLIPASAICFQTLWFLLHPFALVFNDRVEIKYSLFKNKLWQFIDIKKITEGKDGKLYITYKDGEVDRLNLRGIKKAHLPLLKSEFEKQITA